MMTGAFRHYVDVFARGDQRDASQQVVGAPTAKLRNVPCSIEIVNGGEVRRGQQMQAETNTLIVMRFIEDRIKPTDKLVQHGTGTEINVLAAYDPDGRRRETIVQGRSKA
jgi:hypothetical protein